MRRPDATAVLASDQSDAADAGSKALMPVGRPFLDYVLSALADGGITEVCLVVGPEHREIRDRYTRGVPLSRLRVAFAIQDRPLGTADALLAAEPFAAGEEFLALNCDNYYPESAFRSLRALDGPGLPVFSQDTLLRKSHIPAERVRRFAIAVIGADGCLEGLLEKPDRETWDSVGPGALVSMNCWRFSAAIFTACRAVTPSARGELELPDAVHHAVVQLRQRLRAVACDDPVLDLSTRADVASVERRLRGVPVRL